jgi:serine/threonine-protein kinase
MGEITGTTFAGYEVHDVVGTDLVSTLYRASDPDSDRAIALRVISEDLCDVEGPDRQLYRRFRAQATASLKFEHQFSPRVEEVGEYDGQGYLVSPYFDTLPLSRMVDEQPVLPVLAALGLFERLADVLDTGEREGLTHGAVNPSTISFARPAGREPSEAAYLTGYGVGALLELRLKRDRKQLTVVDDLLYVAPEQLRQQAITGRTDQYALACALVHVLTGHPPFVRNSIGGLFGAHLFVEPELDSSQPWVAAARKGMAKDAEQRFDECRELIAAIKADVRAAATRTIAPPAETVVMRDVSESATSSREDRTWSRAGEETPRATDAPQPLPRRRRVQVDGDADLEPPRRRPVAVDRDADDEPIVFAPSTPADWRNGVRSRGVGSDEDAPLLSDVLGQHRYGRRSRRFRTGGFLLLALLGLGSVLLVLWYVVS